jgi:hypothetical protein
MALLLVLESGNGAEVGLVCVLLVLCGDLGLYIAKEICTCCLL